MVRNSFTRAALSSTGSSHDGAASAGQKLLALDLRLAHAADQQIAVVVDVAAHALLGRQPLQIAARHRAEAALLPGIERDHEMARKTFHDVIGHGVGEAFLLQRGDQRIQARLGAVIDTVRIMAPNTSQGGVSSSRAPFGQPAGRRRPGRD